jgi:hypothetical protein
MGDVDTSARVPGGNEPDAPQLHDIVARLRARARALGERVIAAAQECVSIARTSASWTDGTSRRREPRPKNWRSDHYGRVYDNATELRKATEEHCAAGFEATWGYALTEEDIRDVFQPDVVFVPPREAKSEADARRIYAKLQAAIRDALEFGERHHDDRKSPAKAMLAVLLGVLPELPPLEELPGYTKTESDRAKLVERWQERAVRRFGRELRPAELAELSILLGIADPPYRQMLIKNDGQMRVGDVINEEVKRLAKAR